MDCFVHETAIVDKGALIGKGSRVWYWTHGLGNIVMQNMSNIKHFLMFLKSLVELSFILTNSGNDICYCPVCGRRIAAFKRLPDDYIREMDKHGYIHSIFMLETLNILQFFCPVCGASDRSRLAALYMLEKFIFPAHSLNYKLLDIAPEQALSRFIQKYKFITYRSADLYMNHVDDKIDITDMSIYPDNEFDIILCSHVLEHVPEDRKAMKELYRILKPGGWGIVMVPIDLSLDRIFEHSGANTDSLRWKYYGQNDHIRLYSKSGFMDRLKATGFRVNQLDIKHFTAESFQKHGIHPRSVLYIVEKPI